MKRVARRIVLVCVSSIVALGVAEAGFRALMIARFEKGIAGFEHDHFRAEPGAQHLYTMRPNFQRENRVSKAADAWQWKFTTDAAGRRAAPASDDDGGGPRIVALGDSYTFGWGVEDGETYPVQLQQRLRTEFDHPDAVVINAGFPGFNTMQEASYLASSWDELRPDAVVLGFVMNDAEHPRVTHRDPRERFSEAPSWLFEELKLRTGLTDGLFKSQAQRRRAYPLQFEEGAPERALCHRSLMKIAEQCASHSVPLLLFIMPDTTALPKTADGRYPYGEIHALVKGWGSELGVVTVDLLPLFGGANTPEMQVPGDGHPSAQALGIFAEAMAGEVADAIRARPRGE